MKGKARAWKKKFEDRGIQWLAQFHGTRVS